MRPAALLVGTVLAVALAGCTGDPGPSAGRSPDAGTTAAPSGGGGSTPAGTGAPSSGDSPDSRPVPLVTVPARVVTPQPPVALGRPAGLGGGARARVTATRATTAAGQGPGQVRGAPAVAFVLELTAGREPLDLGGVVVDVSTGSARDPAPPVDGPPSDPFSGRLQPGARATATYVFAVPVARRDQVRLVLSVGPDRPVAAFEGPLLS